MTTSTEARDLIDQLDRDGQAFLLGWIASRLDGGRPFTMESLRECVASTDRRALLSTSSVRGEGDG